MRAWNRERSAIVLWIQPLKILSDPSLPKILLLFAPTPLNPPSPVQLPLLLACLRQRLQRGSDPRKCSHRPRPCLNTSAKEMGMLSYFLPKSLLDLLFPCPRRHTSLHLHSCCSWAYPSTLELPTELGPCAASLEVTLALLSERECLAGNIGPSFELKNKERQACAGCQSPFTKRM